MAQKDYKNIIKSYKFLLSAKLGYKILYDGTDGKSSEVFFLLEVPIEDKTPEFKYAFYQIFEMADLSLDGFERIVLKGKDIETFTKLLDARIKGCTVPKSEIVYGLLQMRYPIDQIYPNGKLLLTPTMIKELSQWVNFKGGRNARNVATH